MFAVIYFFMIAPQMRKAKKERTFLKDLKSCKIQNTEPLQESSSSKITDSGNVDLSSYAVMR